ncbi:response regulator [Ohtaekwangia koreensis]|uniref:cAMP-binding domain of CRP or a regulatory subunit of cAMP-dependent protein kinases n=1 Tax=Ohtaekwangia koreensis TaxID=688867 RepID=A0A1T5IWT2_9BACT|nr:response regulator [Ohtaekwangia koreensis]SKC43647.1 cAMP-binding domain of CRP or a regulatory subunit of cAMP-dependent protein kinases [Ohtaekwangia koreensis]
MKKILLIEDNPEIRENTSEILALANYDVVTAENGKIGVELAQHEKPDLIICDIMMPELDGYGVLHILSKKEDTASIPFIFLTAKTEKTDIRKGMNLGADDYLTKPFDDTDLLNAIETRLRKSAMQQKHYEATPEGLDNFIKDAQKVLNIKDLGKDRKVKLFKKKAEIFSEGDMPLQVYFIKSGNVKTFKSHPDGKEFITNLYEANDFFGFEPVLENDNYKESAVALLDSELVAIPRHDFILMMQSHPDVSASFINLLCKKVAERERQLLNLAYNSVRQRTAEALLKSTSLQDAKSVIAISREDLAKMVGTASESVIRVLSDFKEEGIIEIESGKIKIIHPTKLEKVVRWNVAR